MNHGRFSKTLLLALILASFGYAQAQSPAAEAAADTQEAQAGNVTPEPQAPATIKGEGTAGRLPKFTNTYLIGNSVVTENAKGYIGINNTNPTAVVHIYTAPQPPSANNGLIAPHLLQTTGGSGGATTGSGTKGGRGASIVLSAGPGGSAPSGSTTGDGGSIFLRPGVQGAGSGTPGKPGNVLLADLRGTVGIGTSSPNTSAKLYVKHPNFDGTGILVQSEGAGISSFGTYSNGVSGYSVYGSAIYGTTGSASAFAGKFIGRVQVTGQLTVNGNICANNHPCNSDARLKLGIANLGYGLRHLMQLRPVTWQWKEEPTGPLQLGLIAQEVEPIMPALVMRGADASKTLGLNYMGLLPVIIKAVQEQQTSLESKDARIAELQSQVEQLRRERKAETEALRAENEAVKSRLDALERAVLKSSANEKP